MKRARDQQPGEIEKCAARLREAGLKVTHQRLEIFREVARSREHPDAETIYRAVKRRMPTVSLDTVYRTLWLLMDLGLIGALGLPRERMRFDGNPRPHHHFLCTQCGLARDFYEEHFDHLPVPKEVKALGDTRRIYVEIRGICARCLAKMK